MKERRSDTEGGKPQRRVSWGRVRGREGIIHTRGTVGAKRGDSADVEYGTAVGYRWRKSRRLNDERRMIREGGVGKEMPEEYTTENRCAYLLGSDTTLCLATGEGGGGHFPILYEQVTIFTTC